MALTREQQLAEMMKTAQSISAGIQSSAAGFTEEERAKLGAGLTSAQAGLDKYTSTQPAAVQQRVALAKASVPTNVANITQLNPTTLPTLPATEVNPINALSVSSGMQSFLDAYKLQMEQAQARADKLAKENQSLTDKYLGTMKNPEDVYDQAWEDTGMSVKDYFAKQEKGIKEIETLNKEYANVKGAMEQQIAQSNDKMASMNFINNQTAQIRRNAEPQLNTISANISSKAATLEAQQGNFAEARSLVKDAVDAATAGNKFKYDMYKAYYDQNQDNFDRIDSVYKDAFEGAMNLALKDYETQRQEKLSIGELMIGYNQYGAGISINDTLADAQQKAASVAGNTLEAQTMRANLNKINTEASTVDGGGVAPEYANTALGQMFEAVIGNARSNDAAKAETAAFNKAMASGNYEQAQLIVDGLVKRSLTATDKTRFTEFGVIIRAREDLKSMEEEFKKTNPSLYTSWVQSGKQLAFQSKDPAWQSFVAKAQNAINAYRNSIFGASVTGNELTQSNYSLPNWDKDTFGTITTKLDAMAGYAQLVRDSLYRDTLGDRLFEQRVGYEPTQAAAPESATAQLDSMVDSMAGTSTTQNSTAQTSTSGWGKFMDVLSGFKFW